MTLLNIDDRKRFLKKTDWLWRTLTFVGIYSLWVLAFRLLTLTIITYFTISPTSHFQDINDAYSSNEVSIMGLAAVLFIGLLYGFSPFQSGSTEELGSRESIEKSFFPGFVEGSFFAGGMILAFVLSGAYRYLGFFIQFGEAPLELANVVLRMMALGALVYCEEFIFRYKLPRYFKKSLSDWVAASLIAILYCGVKVLQFDLGWMHIVSLFLVSVALYYRTRIGKRTTEFQKGAGFWAGILILFNPLLSLPIFGNDFSGILLIKYQPALASTTLRILSGGAGGPISSFAFQLLLILDIGRSILRRKKLN